MTYRCSTVTLWVSAALAVVLAVALIRASSVGTAAAVFVAGPLLVVSGVAAIAYLTRRELRDTHVADLAAANERENHITP